MSMQSSAALTVLCEHVQIGSSQVEAADNSDQTGDGSICKKADLCVTGTDVSKTAQNYDVFCILNKGLDDNGQTEEQPRPASQASSRGPLKLSSIKMRHETTELIDLKPTDHHKQLDQQGSVQENSPVHVMDTACLPEAGAQPSGFLQTLRSSIPREMALLTGARSTSVVDRGQLPGVAEESPFTFTPTESSNAHNPATRNALDTQANLASACLAAKPVSPDGRPQRFSFFQYFVGKPSTMTLHKAPVEEKQEKSSAPHTPPLRPPSQPISLALVHAQQPSQAASLSPPYLTPSTMMELSELQSIPSGHHISPSSPAGSTLHMATLLQPGAAAPRPSKRRGSTFEVPAAPPPSAPRESAWTQHKPPLMPRSDDRQSSAMYDGHHAPALARLDQVHAYPLQNWRQQAAVNMVKRSRDTLHAAQHATPEQARAILNRITSIQRQQRAGNKGLH
jgi:hypothetical protein